MKEIYCRLCMQSMYKQLSFFDYVKQDQILCSNCQSNLKRLDLHVKWNGMDLSVLYEYNEFLENMIFQYKEGHDVAMRDVFFYEDIRKTIDKYRHYTIVIMPSSDEKFLERGFIPVKEMLHRSKLPIISPFYKSENRKQSLQSYQHRADIVNVIHRKPGIRLPRTKLLLIDDVCTSGSTLHCAYQLLKKHTYKIEALVLSAHPLFVESCDKKGLKKKLSFSILEHVRGSKEGEVK